MYRYIAIAGDNFWEIGAMKITSDFAFLEMLRNNVTVTVSL